MSVEAMWEDYLKSIGELIVESEKTYEALAYLHQA